MPTVLLRVTGDPWGRPATTRPPLHSTRSLLGVPKARADAWGRKQVAKTGDDPPAPPPTHGLTWAGELLAYRTLWDPYVLGVIQAELDGAGAYRTLAAGQKVEDAQAPAIGTNEHPPDAGTLALLATTLEASANNLLFRWNVHRDTPDWEIVVYAGNILQDEQKVVLQAGMHAQNLRTAFPKLPIPDPPTPSAQTAVLGRIESLGIVAHGVLELIGMAADGSVGTLGAIEKGAGSVAEATGDTLITLEKVLPWIVAGVGAIAALFVVAAMTKSGSRSITSVARAATLDPERGPVEEPREEFVPHAIPLPRRAPALPRREELDPDALVMVDDPADVTREDDPEYDPE
jgi:hypothetical protein